jgi:hypothetical protein
MKYCSSNDVHGGFGTEADRLYMSVAHELNKLDWSNMLNVTPDFTVVYVEHEMGGWDVADGMREYVSLDRILQFEERGWLPKLIDPVKLPYSPLKISILD